MAKSPASLMTGKGPAHFTVVRPSSETHIKVGITASPAFVADERLWANGMAQNVRYLAMLLNRLPFVQLCLVGPDNDCQQTSPGTPSFMSASRAVDELDILIEIGIRFDPNLLERFRSRGGKLVSYMAGNAMVMNFESVANGSGGGEIPSQVGFDATWITPQHMRMNASYAALTRSSRVCEVPHIWHPCVLNNALAQFGAEAFFWKLRENCKNWAIGVFDPTVNVVKTFHLPLLLCERAHRLDNELIARVLLFGAQRFIGNQHFSDLVGSLDIGRQGKVFAEARHPVPATLGRHVDAVVTHQWENSLNYLYWDVLYSGRPLIHNTPDIEGAGYRYQDFDPADGGAVLKDALEQHPHRTYQARAAELEILWQFSIDNPLVQSRYADLLRDVMELHA